MTLVAAWAARSPLMLMSAMLLIAWTVAFVMIRKTALPFRAGLCLGIGVVVAATATFGYTLHALFTHAQFSTNDIAIAHELGSAIAPDVRRLFAQITHLGDPWLLAIACVLTAALLARKRYVVLACAVVAASGGNALLNITLKHLIRRTRPVWDTTLATAHGWSFPSGHTSGSIATYGVIAYVLVRTLPARWRLPAVCVALTVMIVTAWSRVIIGVHFASDVLAGSLSGSAWLTSCVIVAECVRRRNQRMRCEVPISVPRRRDE